MNNSLALFGMALGLQDPWRVERCDFSQEQRRLDLVLQFTTGARFTCPGCGATGCPIHDTQEKRWRHMDFFQHQAFLTARVPRVRCAQCGVRQVPVPWARAGSGFTLLMEALILELARHMPVLPLARMLGVSDKRLWGVLRHYVRDAVARMDMSQVRCVGMDETSARRGHDYISLFFDMVQRRLLHVAPDRDSTTVQAFASSLARHGGDPCQVAVVACDMSPAFSKGIRDHLPNARVTFDRFHVTKLLTDAVDRVRRSEMRRDKTIKGSRFSLIKNPEHLTDRQRVALKQVIARNRTLADAYRLKETFRDFYAQPDVAAAKGFLKAWVIAARASGIKAMAKVAKSIARHWDGIIQWRVTGISNAVMEALAGLIQAAKRKARGYRTTENLAIIAFLIAGRLDFGWKT